MGTNASSLSTNLQKFVEGEYKRVKRSADRDHLVFDEVLDVASPAGIPINFTHLGALYVLDSNATGKFTLQQLFSFIQFCDERRKQYSSHEYRSQLEGLFTLKLWRDVMVNGHDHLENWFLKLVCENAPLHRFEQHPKQLYVSRDSLLPLHRLIRPYFTNDMSFQDMFDLMQHCAEDMGILNIEDQDFDDYVPVCVVAEFCRAWIDGFLTMMREVGFTPHFAQQVMHFHDVSDQEDDEKS